MATVEKRGSGYRITVSAGYDMQGRQIKKRMTWTPAHGMTEKQIKKELERQKVLFEERVQSGQILDGSIRFADYADYWLEEYAEKQLRPSTVAGYKDMLRRIVPALGNIKLNRLQPKDLMSLYNKLAEGGTRRDIKYQSSNLATVLKRRKMTITRLSELCGLTFSTVSLAVRGGCCSPKTAESIASVLNMPKDSLFNAIEKKETLSGKTILHHHRLISSMLEKAVRWQIIYSNPCARAEPPKAERKEAEYLDEVQAQHLIDCLQS